MKSQKRAKVAYIFVALASLMGVMQTQTVIQKTVKLHSTPPADPKWGPYVPVIDRKMIDFVVNNIAKLPAGRQDDGLVGSIALRDNNAPGKIIYAAIYGPVTKGAGLKTTTSMRIGSITKAFGFSTHNKVF